MLMFEKSGVEKLRVEMTDHPTKQEEDITTSDFSTPDFATMNISTLQL